MECEDDYKHSSNLEDENEWSFISPPLIVFRSVAFRHRTRIFLLKILAEKLRATKTMNDNNLSAFYICFVISLATTSYPSKLYNIEWNYCCVR
jgi:hypothetical protein